LLSGERRTLDVTLESRTLNKGTATAGGNATPISFLGKLQKHLIVNSGIRQTNAQVFQTDSGEDLRVPKTGTYSTAALVAEAAVIPTSDPSFGLTTFNAYKYAVLLQVTREMIEDTGIDLEGFIAEQAGRAVGNACGVHFISGTGTGQPQGVLGTATTGVTSATGVAGAPTADNLIDLSYSVIPGYRANAYWLLNDSTLGLIRKMKTTTGDYIWQPSVQGRCAGPAPWSAHCHGPERAGCCRERQERSVR
jgi:HK97 family phage major capsid protein